MIYAADSAIVDGILTVIKRILDYLYQHFQSIKIMLITCMLLSPRSVAYFYAQDKEMLRYYI